MVRLVFAVGLLLGACKFDGGGIPHDAEPVFPDADPSCVPTGDEECNAVDDDCDGPVDEDFTTLGDDCDGPDADECLEGEFVCNQAGDDVECNDATDDILEVCDGAAVDEDCDGEMDEGFDVGLGCDGPDTDMCDEGVWQCDGGGANECTDATGDTEEICDAAMVDEDCDGLMNEGFLLDTDESNCGACNVICEATNTTSNLCLIGDCNPVCSNGANDCDSNPDNGCELRNTNPTCNSLAPTDLGQISGDQGSDTTARTRYVETWFEVDITENDTGNGGGDIEADIVLTNPAGVNYDLFVYCSTCPVGAATRSSTNAAGMTDTVQVGNDDTNGTDNGFTVLIEVRWISAIACGDYTLTVNGNSGNAQNIDGCGVPPP